MIYEYFHAIKNKWPKSWDDLNTKGNILPRSNAFKAFMKFLHYIFQNITGQVLDRNDFKSYFVKSSLVDGNITSEQFLPGSGGESLFYKKLLEGAPS